MTGAWEDDGVRAAVREVTESERKAPRHPAQVTADRLQNHLDEFEDYLSNRDRIAFARVIDALADIAAGRR